MSGDVPTKAEHTADRAEQKSDRSNVIKVLTMLLFFNMVCTMVMSYLIIQFGSLLHDATNLTRLNHVISCHSDKILDDGQVILQCKDVVAKKP